MLYRETPFEIYGHVKKDEDGVETIERLDTPIPAVYNLNPLP